MNNEVILSSIVDEINKENKEKAIEDFKYVARDIIGKINKNNNQIIELQKNNEKLREVLSKLEIDLVEDIKL